MKRMVPPLARASLRPLGLVAAMLWLTGCDAMNSLEDVAARGPRRWRVEVWSVPLPVVRTPGVMARDAEPPPDSVAGIGTEATTEPVKPVPQARPSAQPPGGRQAVRAAKSQPASAKKPVTREVRRASPPRDRATMPPRAGKKPKPPR